MRIIVDSRTRRLCQPWFWGIPLEQVGPDEPRLPQHTVVDYPRHGATPTIVWGSRVDGVKDEIYKSVTMDGVRYKVLWVSVFRGASGNI